MTNLGHSIKPLTELESIQNPAYGAYLIWRVGLEYQKEGVRALPLHLSFVVLPLLFHKGTLDIICSTQKRSGLSLLIAKLAEERENLLAVHVRAIALRMLSFKSIGVGISTKLFTIDYNNATLRANMHDSGIKKPPLPNRLRNVYTASERLGYWFSKLSTSQIASSLMLEF